MLQSLQVLLEYRASLQPPGECRRLRCHEWISVAISADPRSEAQEHGDFEGFRDLVAVDVAQGSREVPVHVDRGLEQ